jgi:hypothetical protein
VIGLVILAVGVVFHGLRQKIQRSKIKSEQLS